ncbi:MAG: hypothetical protein ACRC1M_05750 [Methanobacteriaceae archaeon]
MKKGQDNLYSSDIQLLELLIEDQKKTDSLLKDWIIAYPKKDSSYKNWSIELGFSNSDRESVSTDGLVYNSITTLKFKSNVKNYTEMKPLMDAAIKYVLNLVLNSEVLAPKQPKLLNDRVEIKQYYDPTVRIVRFGFREDYDFNYSDEEYKVLLKGYKIRVE